MGVSETGADTMINIYNFYTGSDNLPNIAKKIENIAKRDPLNPVFLLFDNEQISPKPLKKFKGKVKINQTINLSEHINLNLYLITNPLVNNKDECELEDLFKDEVLKLKIKGKSFSRENKFDNAKFYGKHIFSNYISRNYKKIDFERFLPLLDEFQDIIVNYKNS